MTEKTILTERQQAIDLCLKACVNLYGFVTPRQFLKVFNRYNQPKLLKKELLEHADQLEAHSGKYYLIYENAIISSRVGEDVINRTIHMQDGKTYYTPTQEEIALYAKDNFYPRSQHTEKLMQFLTRNLKANIFSANNIVIDIVWRTIIDEPVQKRMNILGKHGLTLNKMADLDILAKLLQDLNNNTKKWANCGYTPVELRNMAE